MHKMYYAANVEKYNKTEVEFLIKKILLLADQIILTGNNKHYQYFRDTCKKKSF